MKKTTTAKTAWVNMPGWIRRALVWFLWFATWAGLMAGQFNPEVYQYVVLFSVFHALLVLGLLNFRVMAFPAQVRLAYLLWVVVGTYVPNMTFLMYITTVGVAANLAFGYCLLARILYLLPWNREEPLSHCLVKRVFLAAPVKGRFCPTPAVQEQARLPLNRLYELRDSDNQPIC